MKKWMDRSRWLALVKQAPLRNSLPVGLFFSMAAAAAYLVRQHFVLDHLPGRMLGLASAAGIDVAARAGVHWKVTAMVVVVLVLVTALLWFSKLFRNPAHRAEARMAQVLSVTGLCSVTALPWLPDGWPLILFQLTMIPWLMAGAWLKRKWLPAAAWPVVREGFYVPAILTSVAVGSLGMVLSGLALESGGNALWLLAAPWVALPTLLWVLRALARKGSDLQARWLSLAWTIAPLVTILTLFRWSEELFFDLNKMGLYHLEVEHCLGILLGALALWMALRPILLARRRRRLSLSPDAMLAKAFYPRALMALVVMPYLTARVSPDLNYFEDASVCLPVSEFHHFGKIPLFEILPPHLISDFIGGFIQALLTGGPESNDFMAVNSLVYGGLGIFGIYVTIRLLLRNAHLAFAFVALMPAAVAIVPTHFAVGGVGAALVLYGLGSKANLKRYLWMGGGFVSLLLWKLDVGYPAVLAAAAIFVMDWLTVRRLSVKWKTLLAAFGIWLGAMGLVALVGGLILGVNSLHNASLALQYFLSEQSYGYDNLGDSKLMPYRVQYFLFFGGALVMLLVLLLRHRNDRSHQQWLMVAFLLFFFLFNFQRGLVRHSLREDWDDLVHSMFYVATAGFALWLAKRWLPHLRWALFCGVGLALVLTTKFPNKDVETSPAAADLLRDGLQGFAPHRAEGRWIPRTAVPEGTVAPQDAPIIEFLRTELNKDQTFLDFSNQPLLYHYAHRQIPSYFAQIPAMLHNDVLQRDFIRGLSNYDVPLAIFTGPLERPLSSGMDDIQNRFRHYRIAEHIYRNYEPWGNVDGNFLWKRKGHRPLSQLPSSALYNGSVGYEDLWLGHIPHLWAETDKAYQALPPGQPLSLVNDSLHRSTPNVRYYRLPAVIDRENGNYICLKFQNDLPTDAMARLILVDEKSGADLGECIFTIPPGDVPSLHALRVSALMTWHYPGVGMFRVETPMPGPDGQARLLEASIQTGD